MNFGRHSVYQCCSICTAKWFGTKAVGACPRCGASTLEAVAAKQLPFPKPFDHVDDPSKRPLDAAAALLLRTPIGERRALLAMAIKGVPPFANSEVGQLSSLLTAAGNGVEASAVSILLESPVRRTTEKLLQEATASPSFRSVRTLIQHLERRCCSQKLQTVHHAYRLTLRLLRHGPGLFGTNVDSDGWVSTESLLKEVNRQALQLQLWRDWGSEDLKKQERLHDCRRIQLDAEGLRVRALYGHSLPNVCAGIQKIAPPQLFHGTSATEFDSVNRTGLMPMCRTLVHLTSDFDYARLVACKCTSPIVLKIDSSAASDAGIDFWRCNGHVWQCRFMPAKFIQGSM